MNERCNGLSAKLRSEVAAMKTICRSISKQNLTHQVDDQLCYGVRFAFPWSLTLGKANQYHTFLRNFKKSQTHPLIPTQTSDMVSFTWGGIYLVGNERRLFKMQRKSLD